MKNPLFVTFAVFLTLAVVFAGPSGAAEESSGEKKELQRIKREMREKKKELKRADRKERSILSDLDKLDRDIQAGKAELARQQKQLTEAEEALRDSERRNGEIGSGLVGLKRVYAERLRAYYKMSRSGFGPAVLASTDLNDALHKMKYIGMIAARDRALIADYAKALDALGREQSELVAKKATLLERRKSIEAGKRELEARKRKKAALLADVRGRKGAYEETLRELEESSASLWAMIKKADRDRAAAVPAQQPARVSGQEKNRFPWPADGKVLTRFGMQRHPQFGTMVFRRGIEIEVREGEPVRAAGDGRVVYADWYKGYGKLVIIEHGPGFYTLYGNLSQVNVAKDEPAAKGGVIGTAGDTGSLKGSKLYFEVRRNGEAQDPLLWLAKR